MKHRIAFLAFPGFQLLDITGPLTAFEYAEHYRPGSYAWRVVAPTTGLASSSSGVSLGAGALPGMRDIDTLVVSGGFGVNEAARDERTLRWLRRAQDAKLRIASVCSGSLLLAAAGLLDGRHATTHWCRTGEFRSNFPAVDLDVDRLYIRDGNIWTSAGITSGIDLALAMISADHGEELARKVARMLVVYHRRPGGQSQFSTLLDMFQGGERFAGILDHVRDNLCARHSVADLAARARLGPRHFVRAFTEETGVPPSKAVERLRVEAARAALEAGAASVQQVAMDCGFGHVERMRRSFLRHLGMPPSETRRGPRRPAQEGAAT